MRRGSSICKHIEALQYSFLLSCNQQTFIDCVERMKHTDLTTQNCFVVKHFLCWIIFLFSLSFFPYLILSRISDHRFAFKAEMGKQAQKCSKRFLYVNGKQYENFMYIFKFMIFLSHLCVYGMTNGMKSQILKWISKLYILFFRMNQTCFSYPFLISFIDKS